MVERSDTAPGQGIEMILAGEAARFARFVEGVEGGGRSGIKCFPKGETVLAHLREKGGLARLVVIDDKLEDMRGIELAEGIATHHPFVNTALVSGLSADEFHEQTEGMGLLMQLASPPDEGEAGKLLGYLEGILGQMNRGLSGSGR